MMKRSSGCRWRVLLLSMLLVPAAGAGVFSADVESLKVVVAEGVGASPDRAKARDDAIVDAQRRAVEEGVGLFVKSDSLVENFQLVSDSIYTHAQGYVHTYEVVSESYRDGEERVTIRAQVRTGKIEQDLDDIWDRLEMTGSPRIVVAIDQPQKSDVPGLAQAAVTEALVGHGFKVLDPEQLAESRSKTTLKLIREGRAKEASILALQDAADIVIAGTATYRSLGKADAELDVYSCEAALDARAVRTDTAEMVAAARAESGAKAGFRQNQATEAALKAAADTWVTRNLGRIVKAAVDPASEYSVLVTGCDHAQVSALDRQLRNLRFVRRTSLRTFDRSVADIEVEFVGSAQRLAEEIAGCTSPEITVERVSARSIHARAKLRGAA